MLGANPSGELFRSRSWISRRIAICSVLSSTGFILFLIVIATTSLIIYTAIIISHIGMITIYIAFFEMIFFDRNDRDCWRIAAPVAKQFTDDEFCQL
ncbi:hypothetical protein [Serratia grimesii]|uniref:hypothetical protein n=1 Tax=Serratia grimesii TaxID=82995 RepID=UPI0021C95FD1|nr:hypothetical protein [Serratia grimesii]